MLDNIGGDQRDNTCNTRNQSLLRKEKDENISLKNCTSLKLKIFKNCIKTGGIKCIQRSLFFYTAQ